MCAFNPNISKHTDQLANTIISTTVFQTENAETQTENFIRSLFENYFLHQNESPVNSFQLTEKDIPICQKIGLDQEKVQKAWEEFESNKEVYQKNISLIEDLLIEKNKINTKLLVLAIALTLLIIIISPIIISFLLHFTKSMLMTYLFGGEYILTICIFSIWSFVSLALDLYHKKQHHKEHRSLFDFYHSGKMNYFSDYLYSNKNFKKYLEKTLEDLTISPYIKLYKTDRLTQNQLLFLLKPLINQSNISEKLKKQTEKLFSYIGNFS